MVDIGEKSAPEILSDKQSDFEDASELLDEEMEALAYSGSDVTSNDARSIGFNDDEFKDALENLQEVAEDDAKWTVDEEAIPDGQMRETDETSALTQDDDKKVAEAPHVTVTRAAEATVEPEIRIASAEATQQENSGDATNIVDECDNANVCSVVTIENPLPVVNGDIVFNGVKEHLARSNGPGSLLEDIMSEEELLDDISVKGVEELEDELLNSDIEDVDNASKAAAEGEQSESVKVNLAETSAAENAKPAIDDVDEGEKEKSAEENILMVDKSKEENITKEEDGKAVNESIDEGEEITNFAENITNYRDEKTMNESIDKNEMKCAERRSSVEKMDMDKAVKVSEMMEKNVENNDPTTLDPNAVDSSMEVEEVTTPMESAPTANLNKTVNSNASVTPLIDISELGNSEIGDSTIALSAEQEDELLKETDYDNDNNLLEEMQDSPRSQNGSSHGSSVRDEEEGDGYMDIDEDNQYQGDESIDNGAQVNEISIDDSNSKENQSISSSNIERIDISSENSRELTNAVHGQSADGTKDESVSKDIISGFSDIATADDNAVDVEEKLPETSEVTAADVAMEEKSKNEVDDVENPTNRLCAEASDEVSASGETVPSIDESNQDKAVFVENDQSETFFEGTETNVESTAETMSTDVSEKTSGPVKRSASKEDVDTAPPKKQKVSEETGMPADDDDTLKTDKITDQSLPKTADNDSSNVFTPETESQSSEGAFDALFKQSAKVADKLEPTNDAVEDDKKSPKLEPVPEQMPPRKIPMDFLKKFKKGFETMSRKDLEDFVLAKIVESLVNKSDYSELKMKCDTQEQLLQTFRIKVSELSKQFRDLEMVHTRVVKDLESRNQNIVTPVKITRAVGLQVSLQKREQLMMPVTPAVAAAIASAKQKQGQSVTPQKAHTTTAMTTLSVAQQNARKAPQKVGLRPKSLENMLQTPPMPPHTPPQTAIQKHQQQLLAKKKQQDLAKHRLLQQQQQQQIHQKQQQMQQQQQQQAMAQKQIIAMAQQQVQQRYGRAAANAVANTTTKADSQQRVPPVVLKKINPNGRLVSVAQTAATSTFSMANGRSPPVAVRQNLMSNCIDLTDEEDTSRQKVPRNSFGSGSHPPALVAFQGQSKQRSMITAQPKGAAQATRPAQKFVQIIPKAGAGGNTVTIQQGVRRQISVRRHPAPLPYPTNVPSNPHWKRVPPRPIIRINNIESGIVISWTMDDMSEEHAEILSYQIYAYQETAQAPVTDNWRHVGDVKAMLLPMAVTLTQFQEGQRYHFAVRAVDEHNRTGMFSIPRTWS